MAKALRNRSILISGAGAAGQSLGYWLRRYGFNPTVIERAPVPRTGGFAVDIRGAAVVAAERMGILDACRRAHVHMREVIRLDRNGDVIWRTDANWGGGEGNDGGDVEILRDDLIVILQEAARDGVEYLFGDTITSIVQDDGGVDVTFQHGQPRRFDLVIGADGLHSAVRSLAFGPEAEFARPLGYYVGVFTMPNVLDLERQWLMSYLPGKMVHVINYGDEYMRVAFIFASPPASYDRRDISQQKALIENAFADDSNWEIPALLKGLREATDLYFDDVTQIHMQSWSNGRVALLGDAAFAPTLFTGQGSSLAVVGAYVLAGEMRAAHGDHGIAFNQYQQEMRHYITQNQRIIDCPELSILGTWEELEQREKLFRSIQDAPDERSAAVVIPAAANAIELKDY
jgi:2-polyprenyl-6-methoxyphenol hydroxylase-like FAD-dependent oxidoreductase